MILMPRQTVHTSTSLANEDTSLDERKKFIRVFCIRQNAPNDRSCISNAYIAYMADKEANVKQILSVFKIPVTNRDFHPTPELRCRPLDDVRPPEDKRSWSIFDPVLWKDSEFISKMEFFITGAITPLNSDIQTLAEVIAEESFAETRAFVLSV
ncbi:hypothetical protein CPC08DRAFT_753663 [Agrocybe pediades]|nr:hypothetical protein CPC08DRAFT_753663 [Agrocybe pediades]